MVPALSGCALRSLRAHRLVDGICKLNTFIKSGRARLAGLYAASCHRPGALRPSSRWDVQIMDYTGLTVIVHVQHAITYGIEGGS